MRIKKEKCQDFKVQLDKASIDRLLRFAKACQMKPEEKIADIVADVLEDDELAHKIPAHQH